MDEAGELGVKGEEGSKEDVSDVVRDTGDIGGVKSDAVMGGELRSVVVLRGCWIVGYRRCCAQEGCLLVFLPPKA